MCHKLGLKNKVDSKLEATGSNLRYAESQIPSMALAESAELVAPDGRSVYCHDRHAVKDNERAAVKTAHVEYFEEQQALASQPVAA